MKKSKTIYLIMVLAAGALLLTAAIGRAETARTKTPEIAKVGIWR